jgi:hypothetical protein
VDPETKNKKPETVQTRNKKPETRNPASTPLRRMKTHTAETGYVYQYYFVGSRPALDSAPEAPATEYVFDVTSDRKTTFAVSVFVRRSALSHWSQTHSRSLNDAEQYAAAKLALLRAFDHTENILAGNRRVSVEAADLQELLAPLLE